jgi:hypothetical protein
MEILKSRRLVAWDSLARIHARQNVLPSMDGAPS